MNGTSGSGADGLTLDWQSKDAYANLTFEITIALGEGNRCDVAFGISAEMRGAGPANYLFLGNEQDFVMAYWSGGNEHDARAHAPGVDSNTLFEQSEGWIASGVEMRDVSGTIHATAAAHNLSRWPNEANEITGTDAARLKVECAKPFRVEGVAASRSFLLANDMNFEGGAGVSHMAAVAAGDALQAPLAPPEVQVVAWAGLDNAAVVTVQGPQVDESWVLTPQDSDAEVRGPAGEYYVEASYALGPVFGDLFVGIMAWSPVEGLQGLDRFAVGE
jgi:hypothetical protein